MRSPTHRAPTPPNPDPLDQQWRAQPAPIATPADEPTQATWTPLWRNGHLLAGRHIARHRRWIRPYDGHWGCLFHPLSEPSRLLYDREGSLFAGISRRLLCSSCTGVGLAPWPLAVDHPRRGLTTVHIVFN